MSRAKSRRNLDFQDVLDKLADMGIAIRVASPKLVMEEVSEILISMQHKTVHNVCQYTETAVVTIANRNILEEVKIRDTKGTFHAKMGSIRDRNCRDLTETEDVKKR